MWYRSRIIAVPLSSPPELPTLATLVSNPQFEKFRVQIRTKNLASALYPFHASTEQSNYHTSASSRSISSFGYSYPEIVDWGGVSQQQLQQNVRAAVNKLYNPPSANSKKARSGDDSPRVHDITTLATTLTGKLSPDEFSQLSVNNLAWQWVLNIQCDK